MDESADRPPDFRRHLRERAFVAGRWVEAVRGGTIAVRNPAFGAVLGRVPDCSRQEVAETIAAAKAAFPDWKARTAAERAAAPPRGTRRDRNRDPRRAADERAGQVAQGG